MVAWRIVWMTDQVRVDPNPPPTVAFSPLEISVLERVAATQKSTRPAGQPVTLQDAIRATATLGGFLGRKSNGVPGVKALWRGYRPWQLLCWWDEVSQNPSQRMSCGLTRGDSRQAFRMPGNLGTPGFNLFESVLPYPPARRKASSSPRVRPIIAGRCRLWVKIRARRGPALRKPGSGHDPLRPCVLALMRFVITSANFHAIGRATNRRSRMLLDPPQGRGFGIGVRLRTQEPYANPE